MEFKKAELKDSIEVLLNCDKTISTEELFVWQTLAEYSTHRMTLLRYRWNWQSITG